MWEEDTTLENCVIAGNRAAEKGGGIYSNPSDNNIDIKYTNCTIINNTADVIGGGLCLYGVCDDSRDITNCIIWQNTAPDKPQIASSSNCRSTISYSDVEGGRSGVWEPGIGLSWGSGNIGAEPNFSLEGDYHILGTSPCIDSGTNYPTGGLPTTDIYGRSRKMDGDDDGYAICDMGAYEFEYNSQIPIIAIDQDFYEFHTFNGQPNPDDQYLSVRNAGGGILRWQTSDDSFWLGAVPASGTCTADVNQVAIKVDTTTLGHGEYTGTVTIFDANAINTPRTILVKLHIANEVIVPGSYTTIQAAVDAVGDGSTIIVADGVYTGAGNRDISFRGKAITIRSENGPENCIIDCQNLGRGFILDTFEENDSILDGFTITNGYSEEYGGAIYCENSSPIIKNCKIMNSSTSSNYGGGIFCENSNAKVLQCIVTGNSSDRYGGGICCRLDRNVTIEGCIITNNYAPEEGGGTAFLSSPGTVGNCMITDNTAGILGGGIYTHTCNTTFYNCTVSGNTAGTSGGGYYCYAWDAAIYNSVFWNDTPNEIHANYADLIVDYSDVQGGSASVVLEHDSTLDWGSGNINMNPNFTFDGNYRLKNGSPCIDAGNSNSVPSDTPDLDEDGSTTEPIPLDLDGNLRFLDDPNTIDTGTSATALPVVDIGAYEYAGEPMCADYEPDGDVDLDDLSVFILHWLDSGCGQCGGADLTGEGDVDLADFTEFAGLWQTGG